MPAARRIEDGGEVRECLLGLRGDVVADELAGGGVDPELARGEDEVAGADRLAVGAGGGRGGIGV